MERAGKSTIRLTSVMLSLAAAPVLLWAAGAQPADRMPEPPTSGTRGPSAIAFADAGRSVWVAEQDTGQVALLNAADGKLLARVSSGGTEPTGLALSADDKTLAVANSFSGSLGIVDTAKRTLRASVPLPGGPYNVVLANGRAFVSVSRIDQVAVVDVAAAKVLARIPVGRRPRCLTVTPDGSTVVCGNMAGGDLSLIDTATLRGTTRVPIGAMNIRGLWVSDDGAHAYVSAQQPHNDSPTLWSESMWSNVLCVVDLKGSQRAVERTIRLDVAGRGAADPYGVAVSKGFAYVAIGGTHELERVDIEKPENPQRTTIGANPRALTLAPDGAVWVANYLGNSLSVAGADGAVRRTIELDPPTVQDIRLRGRYLFNSAGLTRGMGFTCNTCHPDGNTEGLSWRFAHVHDGVEVRNSRNLRGGLLLTGPYGWTGRSDDFELFVNDEVQHLLRGPKLPHGELHAFWNLVNDMDLPPNPYRTAGGALTPAALRGRALFTGAAGCNACHGGPEQGGTGKREWIGTTPPAVKLDVPHLVGAYDSPPYLHDGRAATLEEIFTKYNPQHLHGRADRLTAAQLADVLEYVREL